MLEARTRYHTATLLLDGRVLVAGGSGASGGSTSAELYDPSSGSWTATGSMTKEHWGGTATLLRNGKVLVAAGFGSLGSGHSAELYDPATGSWTATGDMNGSFSGHTATLMVDGRVLIAGGGSAALYDPNTGTWRATGQMIEDRSSHTATLLPDGLVLVAGGILMAGDEPEDDDLLASAELFDPATGTWSAVPDMARGRGYHQAVLLCNGSVLVTGGWVKGDPGQGEQLDFDELYDPANGTWRATGSMDAWRGGGTTDTLLPDGTVLAAGGAIDKNGSRLLASAELYDPSSGMWTATVNMHQARTYYTATLLLDGTVLVAGGYGGGDDNSVLSSAELYDPGSGT